MTINMYLYMVGREEISWSEKKMLKKKIRIIWLERKERDISIPNNIDVRLGRRREPIPQTQTFLGWFPSHIPRSHEHPINSTIIFSQFNNLFTKITTHIIWTKGLMQVLPKIHSPSATPRTWLLPKHQTFHPTLPLFQNKSTNYK